MGNSIFYDKNFRILMTDVCNETTFLLCQQSIYPFVVNNKNFKKKV